MSVSASGRCLLLWSIVITELNLRGRRRACFDVRILIAKKRAKISQFKPLGRPILLISAPAASSVAAQFLYSPTMFYYGSFFLRHKFGECQNINRQTHIFPSSLLFSMDGKVDCSRLG